MQARGSQGQPGEALVWEDALVSHLLIKDRRAVNCPNTLKKKHPQKKWALLSNDNNEQMISVKHDNGKIIVRVLTDEALNPNFAK